MAIKKNLTRQQRSGTVLTPGTDIGAGRFTLGEGSQLGPGFGVNLQSSLPRLSEQQQYERRRNIVPEGGNLVDAPALFGGLFKVTLNPASQEFNEIDAIVNAANQVGLKITKNDLFGFGGNVDSQALVAQNPEIAKSVNDWLVQHSTAFNQPARLFTEGGMMTRSVFSPSAQTDQVLRNTTAQGGETFSILKPEGLGTGQPTQTSALGQQAGTQGGQSATGDVGSAFSDFKFNTGDPEYDRFLNEQFLPQFEAQFGGDPLAMYNALNNPEVLQQAIDRVGRTFGPQFEQAKGVIEEDFARSQSSLDLQRKEQMAQLGAPEGFQTEEALARQRLGEDVGIAKTREARNLSQAMKESADAYASRGRAFGQGRIGAERGLEEESATRISDIEREAKRKLEDISKREAELAQQRGFGEERLGLGQQELQSQRQRQLQELEGEKVLLGREEVGRLRDITSDVLSNPQYYPNRTL